MKKIFIITLCFFSMLILPKKEANAYDNFVKTVELTDGSKIKFGQRYEQGTGYLFVEKEGVNSFETKFGKNGERYFPNDVLETKDAYYVFGYYSPLNDYRNYDGFIVKLDLYGNVVAHTLLNKGMLEEVKWGMVLEDRIIFYLRQTYDDDGRYFFNESYVISLDTSLTIKSTRSIVFDILAYNMVDNLLILSKSYSAGLDIVFNKDLENSSLESEVVSKNGSFSVNFIGEGTLNGKEYLSGEVINMPGEYELVIKNERFAYKVKYILSAVVNGVSDGMNTNNEITYHVSGGDVYINGEKSPQFAVVKEPGNYQMKIYGEGGYVEEYHFSINPEVKNIQEGKTYYQSIELVFSGTATLNGKDILSGTTISDAGDYCFKLYKGDTLYKEYNFTLLDTKGTNKTTLAIIESILCVLGLTGAFLVFKKFN